MRCVFLGLASASIVILAGSSSAAAQPLTREALEARFELQAADAGRLRRVNGGISLAAGLSLVGWAVAGIADGIWDEPSPSLGLLGIGVGLLTGVQGLVWLLIESNAEARLRRLREDSPETEAERYRWEGEDRAYAGAAKLQRALVRWTGLGMIFGGALIAGGSAIDDDLPAGWKRSGYAMGGLHAAIGVAVVVLSAFPSAGEASSGRAFALLPFGGPGSAGLTLAAAY